MNDIYISKKLAYSIIKVITGHKKLKKIVIFGSRAVGGCGRTSDIDIAIWGKDWSDKDVNIVKNTLEESIKTPLKFDILNFYAVRKNKLKNNIYKDGKVIYESGED